jgi:hypothetical protein
MGTLSPFVVQPADPVFSTTPPHSVPPKPSPKSTLPVAPMPATAASIVNDWPSVNVVMQTLDRVVVVSALSTVNVACAVLPVPPSVDAIVTSSFCVPVATPCTSIEIAHEAAAVSVAFDRTMSPLPTTRSPLQVLLLVDRAATPAGRVSLNDRPVSCGPVFGFENVTYLVDSATANSSYPLRVDFYVDVDEGSGEYLVSDSYPASSAQMARVVSLPLPADMLTPVGFVATATDANHYTSEFSPSHVFDRIFADWFQ